VFLCMGFSTKMQDFIMSEKSRRSTQKIENMIKFYVWDLG
jgi:hypothetical protein